MLTIDRYTRFVLTIIAICLVTLCIEGARSTRIDSVHADSGEVYIAGYVWDAKGKRTTVQLGDQLEKDHQPAIPVYVSNQSKK